ncbi:copper homeostasis membrane protein CopD [Pseudomonas chlororaphis]|uniref:copper homeostasis membrane protein CopD n=1 Tax=Pseudomonas chlororaphis TaxID=587753 RepID=UPI0007B34B73|nr:copper homeostasis membrane protein CopD [Pseudomonas chlororaphis]AZC50099.1 Copper resistance protein CopD [Pseudomonas chlororaphis subsp. piscium]AZC62893.1 Copper resistance protein CopD [Pseudomonas chlororaphis subsp. piscium]AZC69129.1 Copper resistance protein CopD [Pseudomonas chlororaphis subsp. piscium]AZC75312.1 Copper resistance protein CopD [Pseudomonas chlororaphis subsp. piscium]KZO49228.1 copper resistance protein CopD [Pseudomonas chlororaphis subsp. piscium]
MSTLLVLCRFVHFAAVLLLFGAWVFRPLLLGREPYAALDRNLTRLGRWLAGIALATGVCWLLLITASMAGSGAAALDPVTLQLVLGNTFFGRVWSWHLLLNGALVVLLLTRLAERLMLRLILAALLLATLAPVGHGAMLDGLGGQLLILNQIVHLSCVSLWLGGLLVLLMILRQADGLPLSQLLRRFSGVGYGLVAGLTLSGLINVRVLTGQLWPTPLLSGFALILLIKVLLVCGMFALALFNRLRIEDCQQRLGTLRRSVLLEWLLGIAAVAAVSLLGTLPPLTAA